MAQLRCGIGPKYETVDDLSQDERILLAWYRELVDEGWDMLTVTEGTFVVYNDGAAIVNGRLTEGDE